MVSVDRSQANLNSISKQYAQVSFKKQNKTNDKQKNISTADVLVGGTLLAGTVALCIKNKKLKNIIKTSAKENDAIKQELEKQKQNAENFKNRLNTLLNNSHETGTVSRDELINQQKTIIDNMHLNYDVQTPPSLTPKKKEIVFDKVFADIKTGTTNRSVMKKLEIPEATESRGFNFELPMSNEVKITHCESSDFKEVFNSKTNFHENYAKSLNWDNDKIARDFLQNFYDGHGQTLDGVRFIINHIGSGKYKVRIEGKTTYSADKALYIGNSTKVENANAAGNYGEGLKMASLKMMVEKGAKDVKIGSDNWQLTYSLGNANVGDGRVIQYSLEKATKCNGNYLEFETNDFSFIQSLRKSINRFYHSGNPHFKEPNFENDLFGIKLLKPGEKGALYIAGQRFEYKNSYDGFNDAILFIKKRIPKEVLDTSRDRVSIDYSDILKINEWLANNLSKEELSTMIKTMDHYFENELKPLNNFVEKLINAGYCKHDLHIQFPDNYVAYSYCADEIVQQLVDAGYRICNYRFNLIGMKDIHDVIGQARKHDIVMPTETQKKKMVIIKEAIKTLETALDKHFTKEELDTHIYLFDRFAAKEKNMYGDTLAEAIIDNNTSKGFWIDKTYLDTASFADVLETALHELSHKVGGDGSSVFGYKLTNVNGASIEEIINNPYISTDLSVLNEIWKTL